MTWLVIPMIGGAALHTVCTRGRFGTLNVVSIFLWFQVIMAAGSAPLLDPTRAVDRTHASIMLGTFLIVLLVGWSMQWRFSAGVPATSAQTSTPVVVPGRLFYLVLGLCVLICIAYYLAVGYNVILQSLFGGPGSDAAELRFETYSGSRYLFPGYVNQFKNALLPAMSVLLVWAAFSLRLGSRWVWAGALTVLNVLFLLGTGQRGAFVTFVLVFGIFLYHADQRRFAKRAIVIGIAAVPLFLLSTVALGRADSALEQSAGPAQKLFSVLGQIWFRIFDSNQEAAVLGFRYIHDMGSQRGGEWWQGVRGLLPGVAGSDLDNRIYEYMYGTDRGTAPLSIWGSAYHNFGYAGTLIFAVGIAIGIAWVSVLVVRWKNVNTLCAIGSAGVTVLVGTWIAGGPLYLLNTGIVIYVGLWLLGARIGSRQLVSAGPGRAGLNTLSD